MAGTPSNRAAPRLRKDAERNRDRIVAAARELFATVGVHVPVEEIARRAGVGVGTLYRRFPDRTELVEAVFLERGHAYLKLLEDALANDDPWDGFRSYLTRLCATQAQDQTVTDVLTLTLPVSPRTQQVRTRIYRAQTELIRRAKRPGGLRPDFVNEDVGLILLANAAIVRAVGTEIPQASPRFVALTLDALSTERPSPLPAPPTADEFRHALQRPAVNTRRPSASNEPPPDRPLLPILPS